MARRDSATARKTSRQSLKLPHQDHLPPSIFGTRLTGKGKRPQGIKKRQKSNPLRRIARLDHLIEVNETQQRTTNSLYYLQLASFKCFYVSRQRHCVMED